MAVEAPIWLTREFIGNALRYGEIFSVEIVDLKVEMAVPKGNNFVCNVYRVGVEYMKSNTGQTVHNTSLIIKEPIYGPMYDSLLKLSIENEVKVYDLLMPKLKSLLYNKDNASGDELDVIPRSYFSSVNNVIILEDLKLKGYVMRGRKNGFDFEHSILALKALAKFHAANKVIIEREPNLIENFKLVLNCDEMKGKLRPIYMANFKNLADEFNNRPGLEKYSKWLYENYKTGLDRGFKLMDPAENEFNVLNHGDFGVQNMLVKYADSTPINIVPIDYQGCRYTSPAIDFYYFLEFNVQEAVRERFDDLVHLYVTELNFNLERYGSTSRLTEYEFKKYLQDRLYLRAFFSVAFLAVAIGLSEETGIFKLEDFSSDETTTEANPFQIYVKNERFIEIITKRFKEYEDMGLL